MANLEKVIFDGVQGLIPIDLVLKLGLQPPCDWWKDWKWGRFKSFTIDKLADGYRWLCSRPIIDGPLNKIWCIRCK